MPRSFSRSIESSTCPTAFLASMVPVRDRSRSARVDLPWSMCATIEKFRTWAMAITAQSITFGAAGRRAPGGSGGDARVVGHDAAGLDDSARVDAGACPDPGPRAHHAAAQMRAGADRDVLPEHRALDDGALAHDASVTEHGGGPDPRAAGDAAARAEHRGRVHAPDPVGR